MKNDLYSWFLAIRPKTLPAAVCPVLVGSALAFQADSFRTVPALLCLLFALLIQIGTNFANDYYDFIKGADTEERQGPKRMTASGLISLKTMQRMTAAVFLLAFLVGLALVPYGGWLLLVVGVLSVFMGYGYTSGPFPLAYLGLGEIFVMIFFGWIAVGCTYLVQAGGCSAVVLLAGTAVGALSTNLLVINNHRDVETDIKANKRTLAVRFGRGFSALEYRVWFGLSLFCLVIMAIALKSYWLVLPLIVLPSGLKLCWMIGAPQTGPVYIRMLGQTAAVMLLFCLLLCIGLLMS
ncbi:1,4-dihydroxy-2-naphthoate polyprenyltransferase [Desulfobulbus rhabdoformis]|uniref:1,4-dihydroxy-2-naphthoate polyprenyltransferase n=1 Tax=Desulfobulbus rhabdoformis TaxID=34032 RepID=UPI0019654A62|nr:1,4-dihydroxy-2-naphthoate polyprenyltransferase [Desulfobulbus rhabdoformis]MBM9615382.1 1,4-dihydroxy-2-naphthoate polyprenyltransferase [Desulfobulbus rhabdoformis]